MDSFITSKAIFLASVLLAYPLIVRALRYRRRDGLPEKYGYQTRESLGNMTMDHAAAIHAELAELEFPFSFINAMEFALFRTYGIPTVSSLLVSTREITNPSNIAKRLTDTGVLMFEIQGNAPSSNRWKDAVARMNYIHGTYQTAGKISNDDLLYTLSLFAREPINWVSRFEWRRLTEMETAAIGTFWKGLGEAMGLDFAALPSHKDGWRDGNHWLDEVLPWGQQYEAKHMVPHDDNHRLAIATLNYILWPVPKRLLHIGYSAFQSLMDDQLHTAMKLQKPSPLWFKFTAVELNARKIFLRYLALPRPEMWRTRYVDEKPNKHGRFYSRIYGGLPIYIEPSFSWRWNFQAWVFWILGKPIPGDGGDKYIPQGYDVRQVGPERTVGRGNHEVDAFRERISHLSKCPFRV